VSRNQNLYDILGLKVTATVLQIKAAFRKLALIHHPDRNRGSAESTARFLVLRNAYDVLSDPAKRREYDAFLSTSSVFGSAPDPGVRSGPDHVCRLSGDAGAVETILGHLNYVLWDIEDLMRSHPDWTVQVDGLPLERYVENMLGFLDRWALTPAGFPDYFHQARDIPAPAGMDVISGPVERKDRNHGPYVNISDYFYHIRLRADKLMNRVQLSDLLRPIPETNLRLMDSILEAHNYCAHYLGQLGSVLRGDIPNVAGFRHTSHWFTAHEP